MEEIKLLKDYVYGIDTRAKDIHKFKFLTNNANADVYNDNYYDKMSLDSAHMFATQFGKSHDTSFDKGLKHLMQPGGQAVNSGSISNRSLNN